MCILKLIAKPFKWYIKKSADGYAKMFNGDVRIPYFI